LEAATSNTNDEHNRTVNVYFILKMSSSKEIGPIMTGVVSLHGDTSRWFRTFWCEACLASAVYVGLL